MQHTYRLILIPAALLLTVTLAWAGISTNWVLGPDGNMRSSTIENTGGDSTWYWDCRGGWSNCNLCETCHRAAAAGKFTVKQHQTVYFPRFQLRVAAGTRTPFGADGEYLVVEGGRLIKLSARGEKIFTFPADALLLRNPAGQPSFVLSTAQPTVHRGK